MVVHEIRIMKKNVNYILMKQGIESGDIDMTSSRRL